MAIDPVFNSVRISEKTTAETQVKTECKTEIPSDVVSKVIDVSAFCGGADYTAEDGVKISGTVIFNVIYITADGKTAKYECAQEFSQNLPDDVEGKTFLPFVKVEKAAADVSGTRLSVYAVLKVGGDIIGVKETPYLSGGEGIIADVKEVSVAKSSGVKKSTFPIDEEIVFPFEVAEVLSQQAKVVLTDVQCGVGTIIVDGEAVVSVLLLQNSENGDIIKEEKTFPFRFELECDEAMPVNTATATASVKSVRSDISVDTSTGKSTADVLIAVNVSGEAVVSENVNLFNDAFSETENTVLTWGQATYSFPCGIKSTKKAVSGKCAVSVPTGAVIVAVIDEKAETVSVKTENGISLQCVYSAKAIYKDADGKIGSITLEIPVEYGEEKGDWDFAEVVTTAVSGKARYISDGETELSGEVIITATYYKSEKLKFVSGIESTGVKPVCDAAISVYIPIEGEGLFSLAKRLNVNPEKLLETNKELNFPLSGKERIVVYRQK